MDFPFDFEVPDWNQFNLGPTPPTDGDALTTFPLPQPPADFYSLLLSPPESSGASVTLSTPPFPTPTPPLAGSPPARSAAISQQTPPPQTPTQPDWQPTEGQILNFDFCPYTWLGQVCGHVSWSCSANKQIKRHMKAQHFPDTSLRFECPNPECSAGGFRFLRKDQYAWHRRACDVSQMPGYVLLPNISSGDDTEVNKWMKARLKQRKSIINKLRSKTPWSEDLLEPVSI